MTALIVLGAFMALVVIVWAVFEFWLADKIFKDGP